MVCPVCGKKSQYNQCPECGFDSSRDYEKYPTLVPVGKTPAVSARRKAWNTKKQPDEVLQRKHPWLALIACAAMLVIGIGIGAGLSGGKPAPTEPSENVQMQIPPETTVPITYEPGKEPWRENILRSDEVPSQEDCIVYSEDAAAYPAFGTEYRRDQMLSVTFLDTLADAPKNAWDVSEAGDGKVLAWVIPNGELYDMYIGAEGGVIVGESCITLFAGYSNTKQIRNLNFLHTENARNMRYMFLGCQSLISLDLSGFNTANVQDMSAMFESCSSLTSLNLSSFDTADVQDMSYLFYDCEAITSLELRNFDTTSVRNMCGMFSGCGVLTTLNLSSFDTSNVQNMSRMFSNCLSLNSLDLSNFNTTDVQDMSNMFSRCESLTNLDLRSFDTANVQDMGAMFECCYSLTILNLSNFDTGNVQNMGRMFHKCLSLTNLDLSNFDTTNVHNTTDMISMCPAGYKWQHLLK